MFITPKTDWVKTDYFNLYEDYFRIKNNLTETYYLALQLYQSFSIITLKEYGIDGIGFADFYNNIERNIDIIADNGYRNPKMPKTATWVDNKPAWTHYDLNRIEGSIDLMNRNLMSQELNKKTIAFTLGADEFEQ